MMGKMKKKFQADTSQTEINVEESMNQEKESCISEKISQNDGSNHKEVKNKKKKNKKSSSQEDDAGKNEEIESSVETQVEKINSTNKSKKNGKKRKRAKNPPQSLEDETEPKMKQKKLKNKTSTTDEDQIKTPELDSENPSVKSQKMKKVKNGTNLNVKKKFKKEKSSTDEINENDDSSDEDSPNKESDDSRDSRTVFVGNVPTKFNKQKLKKLFSEKGVVERMWTRGAKPLSDKISKKTALIANLLPKEHPPLVVYILFKTAADATNALELNGAIFDDHRLRVTLSRAKKDFPKDQGVFVGNVPMRATDDDLHNMFSQCGEIVAVRVVRDPISGKGRGFAYVNFSSADAVELALKLNDEKLNDRQLRVQRLWSDKKMKKLTKHKERQTIKDNLSNPKHKKEKNKNKFSSKKSSEKFQRKKKKSNSVEFKKKILVKKLGNAPKRKEKKSE